MGIFNFWGWFKSNFSGSIYKLNSVQNLKSININMDNLLIDMNGLFHTSTQKIYQYGIHKPKGKFVQPIIPNNKLQVKVFEDICKNIENLVLLSNPKRIVLAIDGPAPYAKIIQQRRRRFSTAMNKEKDDKGFDSNCISPGTKFMDYLSKYIDWYIRKKISEDLLWKDIEIVFSNEKVQSEGENKIISYIRKYGDKNESYIIHGLDADIIMLALGTELENIYVLRDDLYDPLNKFFVININEVSIQLGEIMRWNSEKYSYDKKNAIDDFIFLCVMIGNDFLPHIPSLEILEGGIDVILNIYRDIGTFNGHLTKNTEKEIIFSKNFLEIFLNSVSKYEKIILENKLKNRRMYYNDKILENCTVYKEGIPNVDIERYREEYCNFYFEKGDKNIKQVCYSYLEGLNWVINYYKKGCPNWKWFYPYDHAPSASIISKYVSTFIIPTYKQTFPLTPFEQLLAILPPKSSNLLPSPLNSLLLNDYSPLKEFCPDKFEIDLSGKKHEYQGIVILPMIHPDIVVKTFSTHVKHVNSFELKRNTFGKTFIYKYDNDTSVVFNSFYGNINNCKVKNTTLIL
jgi:5'-3' exoribonuclease 1